MNGFFENFQETIFLEKIFFPKKIFSSKIIDFHFPLLIFW